MSWAIPIIFGMMGAALGFGVGQGVGRAEYHSKKERLREALLARLQGITVPEWIDLPSLLDWIQTAPNEEVLKWVIQALNDTITRWTEFADFVTALLESLKDAFEVRPSLAPSPRIAKRLVKRIMAKPFTEKLEKETKPIII